jgi:DNA-binding response OmpR family regulator
MSVKGTVLVIIEDDPMRALLSAQLNEDGYKTTGVRNVSDVVPALIASYGTVSLVVLDAGQQYVDTHSLEQLGILCGGAPLLLLHGGHNSRQGIDWKGGVYYLARPFTIGEIVERIKTIVEKSPTV